MRYVIYLFILVALAMAAGLTAQLHLSEPVIIRYGEWSAAPALSLVIGAFTLLILAAMLLMHLLLLILFFPVRLTEWRRNRRNAKQARLREETMRQSVYGNRRNLLKQLEQLAPADAAAAWRAAQVAEELGDARKSGKYLRDAAAANDPIIKAAAKAKLSLQDNHLTEADNILRAAGAPQAAVLLAWLCYDVNIKRGDYNAALAAAMRLRDESPKLHSGLVEDTVRRRLHTVPDAAAATAFWSGAVNSSDRKQPALLALYLDSLWRLGDEKAASEGLSQAIKQHAQHNDILRAVADFGTQAQRETVFKANEKRAESADAGDVTLLQLQADLAEKLQLPGKARLYNQMLSALSARRGD